MGLEIEDKESSDKEIYLVMKVLTDRCKEIHPTYLPETMGVALLVVVVAMGRTDRHLPHPLLVMEMTDHLHHSLAVNLMDYPRLIQFKPIAKMIMVLLLLLVTRDLKIYLRREVTVFTQVASIISRKYLYQFQFVLGTAQPNSV